MKSLLKFVLCAVVAGATFISCESDDVSGDSSGMSVRLVDAPGDYENVFIDVVAVEAIVNGEVKVLTTNSGVYDLLTLTGGEFVKLVDEGIPSGDLSQIRLILGSDNSVVLNGGQQIDLQTPSAQQSGLKLEVNYDLQAGVDYTFILDFKVDESVVKQGNAGYLLKPVIRVTTEAESGAVAGTVTPSESESGSQSKITATGITSGEVITAYADEQGNFLLYGVPAGIYTIVVESETGLSATVNNVSVEVGVTTQVGVVALL